MDVSQEVAGTIRAQMDGHPPLVLGSQQGGAEIGIGICPAITAAAGMSGNNQPVLFENHGVDSKYTGPHNVAPTISAKAGTGGNNLPLVERGPVCCITGNAIARQPQIGGNGIGYQADNWVLQITDRPKLIRRLTQLECERLQGFPDGWTDIPSASDSARYKALGNSVAIPCVEYILRGVALALRAAG